MKLPDESEPAARRPTAWHIVSYRFQKFDERLQGLQIHAGRHRPNEPVQEDTFLNRTGIVEKRKVICELVRAASTTAQALQYISG